MADRVPLVSVITPSYNSSKYVVETIQSVQRQSLEDWEMVVVDDHSLDGSADIVRRAKRGDRRIVLIKMEKNSGPASCRNAAIEKARGRYIAFLDSDDLWEPRKLEEQTALMEEKGCILSYTAYGKIDESGKVIGGIVHVPPEVAYVDLLKTNVIGCLTAVYDSRVVGKLAMPDIPLRQDYALWLRILKGGYTAFGLDKCLAYYRVRSRSISRNKLEAARWQWRTYRKIEGLSVPASLFYFAHYVYSGIKKQRI